MFSGASNSMIASIFAYSQKIMLLGTMPFFIMSKNFHVKLGKIWPCWVQIIDVKSYKYTILTSMVKMDGIIEFLAPENVENNLTLFPVYRK